ncbi:PGBD4-like protein [Mya arenaria]|uniref:PGBD4-like protein n=1 Tax=Mya arenaria TaxID=6604 RepID=A0ABY7DVJ7_MYAAR|nr:PGBD4-like protein [Mya arenaria]
MTVDLKPNVLTLNKEDEPVFMRSSELMTCAMVDTKRVHFLSSVHHDNLYDKRVRDRKSSSGFRTVEWPVMCEDYNQHMNGVVFLDQKLGSYAYPHKSSKWYMTIYHHVREVALVNRYIVYCKSLPADAKPVSPRVFREKVIDGLLDGYELRASKNGQPSQTEMPDRLTGRHFVAKYDDHKYRPECTVCSDKSWRRVQTRHYCIECAKPMCPVDCFRIYHTYKDCRSTAGRLIHNL